MATVFEHDDPATDCRTASGIEVQRLATEVGAASSSSPSSPASSQVSDGVTPGHALTPASLPGKVLRSSSPTATALTRSLHGGLAVHRAEVNFSTAAVALAGAPPTTLSAVGVAKFDCGQASWRGLRWPCCCEASVRRRCEAPGRTRDRGCGGEGRRFERERCRRGCAEPRRAVGHGEKMWRRPSPKRGPPPTGEASVAVMPSASPVFPACVPCRPGCR